MSMNKQGPKGIDYLRKGYTWSPFTGCLNGCIYCWARRTYNRFHLDFNPKFHPEKLNEPLSVKRPALIGVCFSGDMWGDWYEDDPDKRAEQSAQIEQVLSVCRQTPQHRFLFLTKNPRRYAEFEIPDNCWCGTSTTGSEKENHRLEELLDAVPTGNKFLSLEPWTGTEFYFGKVFQMDWLIVGGLTGKKAIKPPAETLQKVVDLCGYYTCPVFVKSNAGVGPQEYPEGLKI